MSATGIDLVLDVGANSGQYAAGLRRSGFDGRIVSVEPNPGVFRSLCSTMDGDTQWVGLDVAVGAEPGSAILQVTEDSLCSSMLRPGAELTSRIPWSRAVAEVETPVVTLDQIWSDHGGDAEHLMVKLDIQGFESAAFEGGAVALRDAAVLEVEMGLLPLYDGGCTIFDLLPKVQAHGFQIVSVNAGYVDVESGQVLDIDVLARRP